MLHILIGERTSAIEQRLVERMGYLNPVDMVIKSNIQPYPHLNTRLHNKTIVRTWASICVSVLKEDTDLLTQIKMVRSGKQHYKNIIPYKSIKQYVYHFNYIGKSFNYTFA